MSNLRILKITENNFELNTSMVIIDTYCVYQCVSYGFVFGISEDQLNGTLDLKLARHFLCMLSLICQKGLRLKKKFFWLHWKHLSHTNLYWVILYTNNELADKKNSLSCTMTLSIQED